MPRSIRPDAVLVQAVIAGALSFAHLHDLAVAAGQSGWKAWAYPVSVDLLLVAAWRRLRTARRDRSAWTWFVIALFASLGANVATAGLLDLDHVPAWLRILVAGWPALAFLGGTLLVHTPAEPADDEPTAPEVDMQRTDAPGPVPSPEPAPEVHELDPAPVAPSTPAPAPGSSAPLVPVALLDHARKIADAHRESTGAPMPADVLSARLGLPAPMVDAIAAQLQLA
jgi:hypothetical protein